MFQDVKAIVSDMQMRLKKDSSLRFELKSGCFESKDKVDAILRKYEGIRQCRLPRDTYNEVKAYLMENYMNNTVKKSNSFMAESVRQRVLAGLESVLEDTASDVKSAVADKDKVPADDMDDFSDIEDELFEDLSDDLDDGEEDDEDSIDESDDEDMDDDKPFGQYEDYELDKCGFEDDFSTQETTTDYAQSIADDEDEKPWEDSVLEGDDDEPIDPTSYDLDDEETAGDEKMTEDEDQFGADSDVEPVDTDIEDLKADAPAEVNPEQFEDEDSRGDLEPNQAVTVNGDKGTIVAIDTDLGVAKVSIQPEEGIGEDGESEPNKVITVAIDKVQPAEISEDDGEDDTELDMDSPDKQLESIQKSLKLIKESYLKLKSSSKLPKSKVVEQSKSLKKKFNEIKVVYQKLKKEGRFDKVVPGMEVGSRVIYGGNLMGTISRVDGNALVCKLDNGGVVRDGYTEFELLDQSPGVKDSSKNTVAEGTMVRFKENKSIIGKVIKIEAKLATVKLKEGSILKTTVVKLEAIDQSEPDKKTQDVLNSEVMDRFEDEREDDKGAPDVRDPAAKASDTLEDIADALGESVKTKLRRWAESRKKRGLTEAYIGGDIMLNRVAEIIASMHEQQTLDSTIKAVQEAFRRESGVALSHEQASLLVGKALAKCPNLKASKIKEGKKLKKEDLDQKEGDGKEIPSSEQTDKLEPVDTDVDKKPVAENEGDDNLEPTTARLAEPVDSKVDALKAGIEGAESPNPAQFEGEDDDMDDLDDKEKLEEDEEIDAALSDAGEAESPSADTPDDTEPKQGIENPAQFEARMFLKGMFSTLKVIPEQLMSVRVKNLNPKYESAKFIKFAIKNELLSQKGNTFVPGRKLV